MTVRDQRQTFEKVLERARSVSGQLLKNPLDALRNVYYARSAFDLKMKEAKKRNEAAQRKHNALLIEYIKEKIEQRFVSAKKENCEKVAGEVLDYSKKRIEAHKRLLEKSKLVDVNMAKIIELDSTANLQKERDSMTASETSSEFDDCRTGGIQKDIEIITDKLFGSRLLGDELELIAKKGAVKNSGSNPTLHSLRASSSEISY